MYKVIEICESWYEVIDGEDNHYSISFDKEHMCHLWDITKDAKDGDVLSYRDGQLIFIYKEMITEDTFKYCALLSEKDITVNDAAFSLLISCITPATKEQRDILFSKMKEVGYKWNDFNYSLNNRLTKISEPIYFVCY